mmetsp:Transcript_28668/g.66098  ORF Transcript_28668/g.66098 Transcript_28668/m.66098 type:complete len:1092 (-) Transcript_28668:9-3284(-)
MFMRQQLLCLALCCLHGACERLEVHSLWPIEEGAAESVAKSSVELNEQDSLAEGAGLGVAVNMLMAATDAYFLSEEMASERQAAENLRLARRLGEAGWDVRDRFRAFVLEAALQSGLDDHARAEERQQPSVRNSRQVLLQAEEEEKSFAETFYGHYLKDGEDNSSDEDEDDDDDDFELDEDFLDGLLNEIEADELLQQALGEECEAVVISKTVERLGPWPWKTAEATATKSIEAYCKIRALAAESKRRMNSGPSKNEQLLRLQDIQPPSAGSDNHREEDKTAAGNQRTFVTVGQGMGQLGAVRSVFSKALVLQQQLNRMSEVVQRASDVVWVDATTGIHGAVLSLARNLKRFAKAIGKYIVKSVSNAAGAVKGLWKSFRARLTIAEHECNSASAWRDVESAQNAGLPGANDGMDESTTESLSQKYATASEDALERESDAVDAALLETEKAGNAVNATAMQENVTRVRASVQGIHADLGQPSAELSRDEAESAVDSLRENEAMVKATEKEICKREHGSVAASFRSAFRKVRNSLKAAVSIAAPGLGQRGLEFHVGPIGGGVQEVVDFHNREIGQFTYGAGVVGTSSLGVGVGGYAGIGWKGFKQNWTLESAFVSELSITKGISVFGLPVGGTMRASIDADTTGPGPWVPEPNAIVELSFGWEASTHFAVMPFKYDFSASYSWMQRDECFESLGDLIKYIWLPTCKKCDSKLERSLATATRVLVKSTTFPIITETIYSILARWHEDVYGKDDTRPFSKKCSFSSVNMRDDINAITRQTEGLLFDMTRLLWDAGLQLDELQKSMEDAIKVNPSVVASTQYRKFQRAAAKNFDTCKRTPPSEEELITRSVKETAPKHLLFLCLEMELQHCQDTPHTTLASRIAMAQNLRYGVVDEDVLAWLRQFQPSDPSDVADALVLAECEGAECFSGLQVYHSLHDSSPAAVSEFCANADVAYPGVCTITCKIGDKLSGKCPELDTEAKLMRMLIAAGGGRVRRASAREPFGMCQTDKDCTQAPKQVCDSSTSDPLLRRCMCAKGYCYDSGSGHPSCESDTTKDLRTTFRRMRSFIQREKVVLGELALDLMAAHSNITSGRVD